MLKINHTICPSCSVGCGINIVSQRNNVVGTFPYKRHPINEGKNCVNGRNSIDALKNRIEFPLILKGNEQVESEFDTIFDLISDELKSKSPEEVGVVCSGRNTNEELKAIKDFADNFGFKTGFYSNNFPNFDGEVATYDDVSNASSLFIIGDILLENPLVGRRIVKAMKNGAKIFTVDKRDKTVTSLNSSQYFQVDSISEFLNNIDSGIELTDSSVILLNKLESIEDFEKIIDISKKFNSKILPVFDECNTKGALKIFEPLSKEEFDAFIDGVKTILVFNTDLLEYSDDIKKTDIISFSPYINDTTKASKYVMPIKTWCEKEGSFTNAMDEVQSFSPAIESPDNIFSEIELINKLTEKLGS